MTGNKKQETRNKGFTLVETLIAITILLIAIVGPLYAVHRSIAASYAARDKLIATSLAQEGVEFVRAVRDSNYLASSGQSWLAGLDGTNNGMTNANCFDNNCVVDQKQNNASACASGGCLPLRLSDAQLYTQTVNAAYPVTKFTRTVRLATVSVNEVLVTVTVTWDTLRISYTVTVTERLYNWL